jgi:hypothetical protein
MQSSSHSQSSSSSKNNQKKNQSIANKSRFISQEEKTITPNSPV